MPCECVRQSVYNVHKETGSLFLCDRKREIMRDWADTETPLSVPTANT